MLAARPVAAAAPTAVTSIRFAARPVWSIKRARARLEQIIGASCDWAPIDALLVQFLVEPAQRRTAVASTLAASLELAREGMADLRQEKAFAPLFVRRRARA